MQKSTLPSRMPPVFREQQRFRQWWLWVIIVGPAAMAWWLLIQQVIQGKPVGQNPAPDWLAWVLWVAIGLGLPFLFSRMSMVVEVSRDTVLIVYRPFSRRTIPLAEIERAEARTYNAVKEYGGWGIKGWSKAKMAYNVSGNHGVELTLTGGRSVMIGSQQADELAAAVQSGLRARGPIAKTSG
jgi:hypothetical protein